MKVVVSVPSRVHMTLIELGLHGYRRNGGIGFAVEAPSRHLEFARASAFDLGSLAALGFTPEEIGQLSVTLAEVQCRHHLTDAAALLFATGPGRHVGTGSGTAVTLACLEALFYLNRIPVEPAELIRLSGRGGTSGIGIHTYFDGGFVVDVGRQFDTQTIVSSDEIQRPAHPATLLARYSMPHWRIGLLLPSCPPLTLAQERGVFASLATDPISPADVHEIAYHSMFGATAAVAASDFHGFCDAVNTLQRTAWKRREIAAYGAPVASVMGRMRELGCDCVGLSSMGPGLYFLAADFDRVMDALREQFPDADIVSTVAANRGREIHHA
jgi:beta-ribofuranosylaminobenzene 5'-phosphate synthase